MSHVEVLSPLLDLVGGLRASTETFIQTASQLWDRMRIQTMLIWSGMWIKWLLYAPYIFLPEAPFWLSYRIDFIEDFGKLLIPILGREQWFQKLWRVGLFVFYGFSVPRRGVLVVFRCVVFFEWFSMVFFSWLPGGTMVVLSSSGIQGLVLRIHELKVPKDTERVMSLGFRTNPVGSNIPPRFQIGEKSCSPFFAVSRSFFLAVSQPPSRRFIVLSNNYPDPWTIAHGPLGIIWDRPCAWQGILLILGGKDCHS